MKPDARAIVFARTASWRRAAIAELAGWPVLVGRAVREASAVWGWAAVLGRRWPAAAVVELAGSPIVELARAAILKRALLRTELRWSATARSAGRAPRSTARRGVAGVLGRLLVPGQEQANGVPYLLALIFTAAGMAIPFRS